MIMIQKEYREQEVNCKHSPLWQTSLTRLTRLTPLTRLARLARLTRPHGAFWGTSAGEFSLWSLRRLRRSRPAHSVTGVEPALRVCIVTQTVTDCDISVDLCLKCSTHRQCYSCYGNERINNMRTYVNRVSKLSTQLQLESHVRKQFVNLSRFQFLVTIWHLWMLQTWQE